MRHTSKRHTDAADRTVKDIRRKTRKRYSSEDKIRFETRFIVQEKAELGRR